MKMRAPGTTIMLALIAVGLFAAAALGADPTTAPAEVLEGGDLRSEGEGPGLVGNPLLILAAVVALGFGTALVTLLIVRLTRRD
ncbi:MAG: hypothetical protein U9O18_08070 [Chloroflexota bacterium]|nr:hypothetical protein [Chloroflexota bacterium]